MFRSGSVPFRSVFRNGTQHIPFRFKRGESRLRIADFAKKYHVSEQAVRGRIKRAGYTLEDLRQPGSAHLSEEGEKVVSALFDTEKGAPSRKGKGSGQDGTRAAGAGGPLAIIRAERDELRTRAAAAETLAQERESTIKFLQDQIREKDEVISKLAAAAGALRAALPDPGAEEPKKPRKAAGFFRRLFKR